MRGSHVPSANLTILSLGCEVHTGTFAPVLHPDEACCITVPCDNPGGEKIITCKDSRKGSFLSEVGGLQLDTIHKSDIREIPAYIPIYDYRTLAQAFICDSPVIGISLRDILLNGVTEKAGVLTEQPITFRDPALFAELCNKKRVILFLAGPDTLIEWVWYNRNDCGFYTQLQQMGFWAVTGFNFSVFAGECPFAQALNQKRSLYSAWLLEQNDIQSIPHIYAVTEAHIARFNQWLLLNPTTKAVTINCQMQKSQADISQLVHAIKRILTTNEQLHIIVQGFRFSEAYRLKELLSRIHFADAKAVKYGQIHLEINMDENSKAFYEKATDEDFKTLVQHNVRLREKQQDMIRRSTARQLNFLTKNKSNGTQNDKS